MSKEYPCVYYDKEKCTKFDGDGVTSYCVLGPCAYETSSNADHMRSMSDKELAEFLNYYAHDAYMNPSGGWDVWLKQPYKEDGNDDQRTTA